MDYDEDDTRRRFEDDIRLLYNGRSKKPEWTRTRICEVISYIEEYNAAPGLNRKRNHNHHFYAHHYDVMLVSNQKFLIFKRNSINDPIVKVLPSEEYYDTLLGIHKSTGHGGRDKMLHTLKSKYFIPTPVVVSFAKLCVTCQNKKDQRKVW